MSVSFLTNLNEEEFKTFLKSAISEIMGGTLHFSKPSLPDIFDIKQAADFLKLKINTLYEKTSKKIIPHFKKGNKLYFNRAELQSWLQEGRVKTTDEIQGEAVSYSIGKGLKK
ncbi:MAG: helix-turn-helix domain-containing protein [Bacteroidetes bacterium]|nr:helix-turn-helix domain-containing protein [Bacteroidota bacterium]